MIVCAYLLREALGSLIVSSRWTDGLLHAERSQSREQCCAHAKSHGRLAGWPGRGLTCPAGLGCAARLHRGGASPPAHLTGGALQAHDKRFAPGDVVLVHDRKGEAPRLNGCYASVADGPLANGRFRLRLATSDIVDVAPPDIVLVSVHARKRISP